MTFPSVQPDPLSRVLADTALVKKPENVHLLQHFLCGALKLNCSLTVIGG